MVKKQKKFKTGDVITLDLDTISNMSEEDKIKYYGVLGYGSKKPKLYTYITNIKAAGGYCSGHCILISLSDQSIETMRHIEDFRKATDEEF